MDAIAETCSALLERGIQALSASKLDEACDAFTEAAATASSALLQPAVPDAAAAALRVVQGRSYGNLANIFGRRNELDGALMFSHKALAVFRDIGEPERAAVVLFNLAVYSERLGRMEEAIRFMEEVLASTADPERVAQASKWLTTRRARLAAAAAAAAEPPAPPTSAAAAPAPASSQQFCQTLFCPASAIDAACFGDGSGTLPPPPPPPGPLVGGSSAGSAPQVAATPSSGGGIVTPMLEFGFENLWYADVLARNDREAALLEAVDASLKARAAASEAYARGLAESAVALSAPLTTTGLGIGRSINGAGRATAGVGAAMRSALSFLTGAGAAGAGSAASQQQQQLAAAGASADTTGFGGGGGGDEGGGESHAGVLSGGYDSLHSALAAMRRSAHKEAAQQSDLSQQLRRLSAALHAHKVASTARSTKLLGRAADVLRHTQAAAANLGRAHLQLDRTRRDLAERSERLRLAVEAAAAAPATGSSAAATAAAGAALDAEAGRRERAVREAEQTCSVAEEAVRDAGDALVKSRQARNTELVGCARQLQGLDEERRAALSRTVAAVAALGRGAADYAALLAAGVAAACNQISVTADERMFIHQRRIAVMMDELQSRLAARKAKQSPPPAEAGGSSSSSGGVVSVSGATSLLRQAFGGSVAAPPAPAPAQQPSADFDDPSFVIPSPQPVTSVLKHHNDYIRTEERLAPLMYRWVGALLKNAGAETLHGVLVSPAAPSAVIAAASAAAGEPSEGGGSAAAPGAAPLTTFEVSLLDELSARHAFLRALSARRSIIQDVGPAFTRFCHVFWWLLDACQQHEDSRAAQTVLILSETFYQLEGGPSLTTPAMLSKADATVGAAAAEGDGGEAMHPTAAAPDTGDAGTEPTSETEQPTAAVEQSAAPEEGGGGAAPVRQYVQTFIRHHPIWRSDFWQESFYRAVRDEVGKMIDPTTGSSNRLVELFAAADADDAAAAAALEDATSPRPLSPGAGESAAPSPAARRATSSSSDFGASSPALASDTDPVYSYCQVLMGQLLALAVNMQSFGMASEELDRMLAALAAGNGLPRSMAETVRAVVQVTPASR